DGDRLVLGQQIPHTGEAPDLLEHAHRHQHRLANDTGYAKERSQRNSTGDVPVELEVFEHGAGLDLVDAGEEVRHQAHSRLGQVAGRLAEVGRPHAHVRVADQDRVMLAAAIHRGQVLDFGVEPEARSAHDQLRVPAGEFRLEPANDLDGRVVAVGD